MTWRNLYEQPARTSDVPVGTTLGARDWLLRWYLSEDERQDIIGRADELQAQVAELKERAGQIANATQRSGHIDRLNRINASILAIVKGVNRDEVARETYEAAVKQIEVSFPTEITTLTGLINADIADPTGDTAEKMIQARLDQLSTQEKEREAAWAIWDDPAAWAKQKIEEGGEGLRDAQWFLFKQWIRTFWPWVVVGGGALAAFYFWPWISRYMLAKRAAAGKPAGLLPNNTRHQPGE